MVLCVLLAAALWGRIPPLRFVAGCTARSAYLSALRCRLSRCVADGEAVGPAGVAYSIAAGKRSAPAGGVRTHRMGPKGVQLPCGGARVSGAGGVLSVVLFDPFGAASVRGSLRSAGSLCSPAVTD